MLICNALTYVEYTGPALPQRHFPAYFETGRRGNGSFPSHLYLTQISTTAVRVHLYVLAGSWRSVVGSALHRSLNGEVLIQHTQGSFLVTLWYKSWAVSRYFNPSPIHSSKSRKLIHIALPLISSLMSEQQWRMTLNNFVQRRGIQNNIAWGDPVSVGALHAPSWTITVYYKGVQYGRGTGATISQAKEIAAQQAYRSLLSEM
ncbi:hypothetical protein PLICRDRAFT_50015 [Plicaturopsis crispa FD-325 SS-3]|nr:hypothetical protein PLICRDRAFT_50015 [Plicaturopsis crispa FD-325 SS-3]